MGTQDGKKNLALIMEPSHTHHMPRRENWAFQLHKMEKRGITERIADIQLPSDEQR